ncbi:MAG: DUF1566 domain-containing protein [Thermodesulfobacteriota bacterium]
MKRFLESENTVTDEKTGLMWFKNASFSEMPLTFKEALEYIKEINQEKLFGFNDWKLPNRREFLSIISLESINPCVNINAPFYDVFNGYYWTSTTCSRTPDQAWIIHLGGARVRGGIKNFSYMVWPVRNTKKYQLDFFNTGQINCYDDSGNIIDCRKTGQDGEFYKDLKKKNIADRFDEDEITLKDKFTGLQWLKNGDLLNKKLDYHEAVKCIEKINSENLHGFDDWRIPKIEEFDSIADMGKHSPAIVKKDSFLNIKDYYWSCSLSEFNKDYLWVFYTKDGYIGVGFKENRDFYLLPVRGEKYDRSFFY